MFDTYIEARNALFDWENNEIAEKRTENIYKMYPGGKSYIVGTQTTWSVVEGRRGIA